MAIKVQTWGYYGTWQGLLWYLAGAIMVLSRVVENAYRLTPSWSDLWYNLNLQNETRSNWMRKHRATGRPRGRPTRLPHDLGEQILKALEQRVNPETGLVKPYWNALAREFCIGRSTVARLIVKLRQSGEIESVAVRARPDARIAAIYYRLKRKSQA